jgi:hypothetical protein
VAPLADLTVVMCGEADQITPVGADRLPRGVGVGVGQVGQERTDMPGQLGRRSFAASVRSRGSAASIGSPVANSMDAGRSESEAFLRRATCAGRRPVRSCPPTRHEIAFPSRELRSRRRCVGRAGVSRAEQRDPRSRLARGRARGAVPGGGRERRSRPPRAHRRRGFGGRGRARFRRLRPRWRTRRSSRPCATGCRARCAPRCTSYCGTGTGSLGYPRRSLDRNVDFATWRRWTSMTEGRRATLQ